jgi:hypothetical protein
MLHIVSKQEVQENRENKISHVRYGSNFQLPTKPAKFELLKLSDLKTTTYLARYYGHNGHTIEEQATSPAMALNNLMFSIIGQVSNPKIRERALSRLNKFVMTGK